jgi:hypothetical protein
MTILRMSSRTSGTKVADIYTASATKPTTQRPGTAIKPSAIGGNDDFFNGHNNQLMMGRLEE